MRVICPFTSLHPDTERSLRDLAPETEWWDVSGSVFAYSQLLENLWKDLEDVLIVEHDIELTEQALTEHRECDYPWSVAPFRGPSAYGWEEAPLLTMSLGCTRFSADLMRAMPDAVAQANAINDAGTVCPPGDWHRLDCRLWTVLRGHGDRPRSPHVHAEVPHHHVFDYGCSCGKVH